MAIHGRVIADHGGSLGVRDFGLLESAIAAPRHRYSYGEVDTHILAAAYAHAITRNHPFIDGNKRVAFMAAYTFLGDNGLMLEADRAEATKMMLELSEGSLGMESFRDWLRKNCVSTNLVPRAVKSKRKPKSNGKPTRRKRQ